MHIYKKPPYLKREGANISYIFLLNVMTRAYSTDLRWRVLMLSRKGYSTKKVAFCLSVGISFVKKIKRMFRENSSVNYRARPGGQPKLQGM